MTRPDTLPPFIADALDKPLVGPVALVLLGIVFVLLAYWAITEWNAHTKREINKATTEAFTDPRYAPEFESAAHHWHKPPVTWTDDDSAHLEAVANKETDR